MFGTQSNIYIGAFPQKISFCKIYKKTFVPECLFNKFAGPYSATSLKGRTPT